MFDKEKLTKTKNDILKLYKEKPLEMMVATAAAVGAVTKIIHTVTEAQNAQTWRREVRRRERKQRK